MWALPTDKLTKKPLWDKLFLSFQNLDRRRAIPNHPSVSTFVKDQFLEQILENKLIELILFLCDESLPVLPCRCSTYR